MRVLVTGAAGFLGAATVRALVEHGHVVRALVRDADRRAAAWPSTGVEVAVGDVRAVSSLEAALAGVEVVVHLAAQVSGTASEQFTSTVGGTERLVEALSSAAGAGVRRVVLASSFAVYDWSAARTEITEDTALTTQPWTRGGYAVTKVWQERVLREAAQTSSWDLTVLRPGFIYGRGRAEIAGAGQRLGPLLLSVRTRLPLTYVDNCADAFALAAERELPSGTTLDVVDSDEVTSGEYARRSAAAVGVRRTVPVPYRLGLALARCAVVTGRVLWPRTGGKLPGVLDPPRYEAMFKPLDFPHDAAARALGWRPRVAWDEAAERSFSAHEEPAQEEPAQEESR